MSQIRLSQFFERRRKVYFIPSDTSYFPFCRLEYTKLNTEYAYGELKIKG
jgi:hypothetical protein